MKWTLLAVGLLALTGCDKPRTAWRSWWSTRARISADAYLCGRAGEAMPWREDRYLLLRPADCRGAGRVVVTFRTGQPSPALSRSS